MKKSLIMLGVLAVAIAVYFAFGAKPTNGDLAADYKQATYYISGKPVKLGVDGVEYFGK